MKCGENQNAVGLPRSICHYYMVKAANCQGLFAEGDDFVPPAGMERIGLDRFIRPGQVMLPFAFPDADRA